MPTDTACASVPVRSPLTGAADAGRAALVGVQVLGVTAMAHALAGGGLPDALTLILLAVLACGLSWMVRRRRVSRACAVLALVLAQPILHLLMAMGGAGHETAAAAVPISEQMHHGGHTAHAAHAAAAAGGPSLVDLLHLTPAMVSGHLAAMIVSALLLALPSRAVRFLALRWERMRTMLTAPALVLVRIQEARPNNPGCVLRVLTSGPAPVRGPPLAVASPHTGGWPQPS